MRQRGFVSGPLNVENMAALLRSVASYDFSPQDEAALRELLPQLRQGYKVVFVPIQPAVFRDHLPEVVWAVQFGHRWLILDIDMSRFAASGQRRARFYAFA